MAFDLILALHFAGLFMGGAPAISLLILGGVMGQAPQEHRASIAKAVGPIKTVGKVGMGILLITGILMATVGGVWGEASAWFWIKLLAVVVLISGIVLADKTGVQAMAGDAAAAEKVSKIGKINLVSVFIVILAAVLAFH